MRACGPRFDLRPGLRGLARGVVLTAALLASGSESGTGAAAAAAQTAGPDSAEPAVRGLLDAQREAWNRGDLEGFMAGYWSSPDLVFTSGGRVQRGWRTVLDRYRATYGTGAEMGRLTFSELEVYPLGSEAAWALGRWELDLDARLVGGVFTLVLRWVDGKWRIVHDHTSTGPEPEDVGTTSGSSPEGETP